MATETDLGKLATARTTLGEIIAVGRIMSYCDAPTVGIHDKDGNVTHWRADMVTVHSLDKAEVSLLMGDK